VGQMGYTIGEAAKISGLTPHTLRYYDKAGLLPFLERTESGLRNFQDSDIEWLSIINCLKSTGMSIKDIKQYINWCQTGDNTIEKRREAFIKQKEIVEKQMRQYQKYLDTINYKIWYYNKAIEAGTEKIHDSKGCNTTYK
jgi:DNA-binding transcriptional MerR regulator